MTDTTEPNQEPVRERASGALGFAMAWMLALSIIFSLLPVIGPFIAGAVGGWRSRRLTTAIAAAIVPALFLAGITASSTTRGVPVGQSTYTLPSIFILIQELSLLAGLLTGVRGRLNRIGGLVLLVVGMYLFQRRVMPVVRMYRQIQASRGPQDAVAAAACPDNLKKLYNAAMFYADSYDALPPADRWTTALTDPGQNLVPDPKALNCPAVPPGKMGYAMNAAVGGMRVRDVKDGANTPLFYDSSTLGPDAHDDVTSLPQPGRHSGKDNVIYMDGHVGQR